MQQIDLADEPIRPRLVLEKCKHSGYGSITDRNTVYYLVAFNAQLSAPPQPCNEIAALLYLNDTHLSLLRSHATVTLSALVKQGAHITYQPGESLHASTVLVPHGTAAFLVQQQSG